MLERTTYKSDIYIYIYIYIIYIYLYIYISWPTKYTAVYVTFKGQKLRGQLFKRTHKVKEDCMVSYLDLRTGVSTIFLSQIQCPLISMIILKISEC